MDVCVSSTASGDETKVFQKMLRDFNIEQMGEREIEHIFVLLRDADGNIQGGLDGLTILGWLYIDHIVVHKTLRGKGYGSRLMRAAEEEARRRGCHSAYLQTYSWQARPFYEKHGYTVYGTLDDFPEGHQRFCMAKYQLADYTKTP